jgi:hypothetical protein
MSKDKSLFHAFRRRRKSRREEDRFLAEVRLGRYALPPHSIKVKVMEENTPSPRPGVFIETGTYHGDTVNEMKGRYGKVVSIEVDPVLCGKARERFRGDPNVEIVLGDCARELPRLLEALSERAVFWLDGHWSGEGTGKGEVEEPVLLSLRQIREHPVKGHVIFIDDARYFDGRGERPGIVEVLLRLQEIDPSYRIRILDDIVIAIPDPEG